MDLGRELSERRQGDGGAVGRDRARLELPVAQDEAAEGALRSPLRRVQLRLEQHDPRLEAGAEAPAVLRALLDAETDAAVDLRPAHEGPRVDVLAGLELCLGEEVADALARDIGHV